MSDLGDHPWAHWGGSEKEFGWNPRNGYAVDDFLYLLVTVIRYDDFNIERFPQLTAEPLEMSLHPAHVRRVKFANVKDTVGLPARGQAAFVVLRCNSRRKLMS
jgi:hypothetical protein